MDAREVLAHLAQQERARILRYEAGPGLDAKIARVVFGHRPFDIPGRPGFFLRQEAGYPVVAVPPYSTEAGAAWLVCERLRTDGWSYMLADVPEFSSAQQGPLAVFRRGVIPPHQRASGIAAVAETMPLAVCRAALMAMLDAPDARP